MAKGKNAGADATPQKPRFDNSHFNPEVLYHKALMGRYPSAAPRSPNRADELRYWHNRMVAAGLDPGAVERRVPTRIRAEAEAVTRNNQ